MKKFMTIALMLLLALSLGLLSACGQPAAEEPAPAEGEQPAQEQEPESTIVVDQDVSGLEAKQDEALIGDWYITNTEMYGTETAGYCRLSFAADGSYVQAVVKDGQETTVDGTWTVATGQLTLISGDRNVSYDYQAADGALTLSSGDSTLTFGRTQPE